MSRDADGGTARADEPISRVVLVSGPFPAIIWPPLVYLGPEPMLERIHAVVPNLWAWRAVITPSLVVHEAPAPGDSLPAAISYRTGGLHDGKSNICIGYPVTRDTGEIRFVPLSGLHADVLEKLASILVGKDVPAGVVALVGEIPGLWDQDLFEVA